MSGRADGAEDQSITLLEFTSVGCGACQQIKPFVLEMKDKGYPIEFVSYDRPEHRALFRRYGIQTMPSFVMLCHGNEVGRFISQGEGGSEVQRRLLEMFRTAQAQARRETPVTQRAAEQRAEGQTMPITNAPITNAPSATSLPPVTPIQIVESATDALSATAIPAALPTVATAPIGECAVSGTTGALSAATQSVVRIRVYHENAVDRGTGTIIHVNQGRQNLEALVLTCGHIFRPSQGKGRLELDLFDPQSGRHTTVGGECIYYDDEVDVAFIGIPLPFAVQPVSMAAPEYQVKPGDRVVSFGCSGGDAPTRLEHQVISTDKKFFKPGGSTNKKPFYYIQVSTAPVGGRSGGGLFVQDDSGLHLLGVCNAGDTESNEGFFVPAAVVFDQMTTCQSLSFVYNDLIRGSRGASAAESGTVTGVVAGASMPEPIRPASFDGNSNGVVIPTAASVPMPSTSVVPTGPIGLAGDQHNTVLLTAGLEELKKRQLEGAEIICIVNWPNAPSGQASHEMEVIRLPRK